MFFFVCLFVFCSVSLRHCCSLGQAGLELLVVLLPQLTKYWDYRFGNCTLGDRKKRVAICRGQAATGGKSEADLSLSKPPLRQVIESGHPAWDVSCAIKKGTLGGGYLFVPDLGSRKRLGRKDRKGLGGRIHRKQNWVLYLGSEYIPMSESFEGAGTQSLSQAKGHYLCR